MSATGEVYSNPMYIMPENALRSNLPELTQSLYPLAGAIARFGLSCVALSGVGSAAVSTKTLRADCVEP